MPVRCKVRILDYKINAACSECGSDNATDDTSNIHVFVDLPTGAGNTCLGPLCHDCRYVLENSGHGGLAVTVEVAEPDKRGPPSRRDKKLSQRQEKRIADDIGGRTQPGSGSQEFAKSDVRKKGEFRVEAKFTRNKSFPLKREILDKISSECVGTEKPVLQIDFLEDRVGSAKESWAVIPYEHWEELIRADKNKGP